MRHFLASMDYNGARNTGIEAPDPKVVGSVESFTNPKTQLQID